MIKDMVARLESEAEAEASQKEWCDKEMKASITSALPAARLPRCHRLPRHGHTHRRHATRPTPHRRAQSRSA